MPINIEFDEIRALLRKHMGEPEIQALAQNSDDGITHSGHVGFMKFKDSGISISFKEAPWVVSSCLPGHDKYLYVDGAHFYSNGYDGNAQYRESFPGGLSFGDTESDVTRKLGQVHVKGGGEYIKLLKKKAPLWVKYEIDNDILHVQFNEVGNIDLITIFIKPLH